MKLQQTIFCLLLATCCLLGSCGYTDQPPVESTDQTTEKPTAESTIESSQPTDTSEPTLTIDPSEFVVQPTVVESVEVLDHAGNPFTVTLGMSHRKLESLYCSGELKTCEFPQIPEYQSDIHKYTYVFLKTPLKEDVVSIIHVQSNKIVQLLLFTADAPTPSDDQFEALDYGSTPLELIQFVGIPEQIIGPGGPYYFYAHYTSSSGRFYNLVFSKNLICGRWYTSKDDQNDYTDFLPFQGS